eukprot:TRINITY_DN2460_c0_g1_i4.p1 TRINITY_DN2460_c0_g1~~TRINITY_DN2460_c0_g1_i4.p1  ORF type:complete len:938 (+),score=184.41 TRINITY_DN2460_c0_g1_i4:213-3026(+)
MGGGPTDMVDRPSSDDGTARPRLIQAIPLRAPAISPSPVLGVPQEEPTAAQNTYLKIHLDRKKKLQNGTDPNKSPEHKLERGLEPVLASPRRSSQPSKYARDHSVRRKSAGGPAQVASEKPKPEWDSSPQRRDSPVRQRQEDAVGVVAKPVGVVAKPAGAARHTKPPHHTSDGQATQMVGSVGKDARSPAVRVAEGVESGGVSGGKSPVRQLASSDRDGAVGEEEESVVVRRRVPIKHEPDAVPVPQQESLVRVKRRVQSQEDAAPALQQMPPGALVLEGKPVHSPRTRRQAPADRSVVRAQGKSAVAAHPPATGRDTKAVHEAREQERVQRALQRENDLLQRRVSTLEVKNSQVASRAKALAKAPAQVVVPLKKENAELKKQVARLEAEKAKSRRSESKPAPPTKAPERHGSPTRAAGKGAGRDTKPVHEAREQERVQRALQRENDLLQRRVSTLEVKNSQVASRARVLAKAPAQLVAPLKKENEELKQRVGRLEAKANQDAHVQRTKARAPAPGIPSETLKKENDELKRRVSSLEGQMSSQARERALERARQSESKAKAAKKAAEERAVAAAKAADEEKAAARQLRRQESKLYPEGKRGKAAAKVLSPVLEHRQSVTHRHGLVHHQHVDGVEEAKVEALEMEMLHELEKEDQVLREAEQEADRDWAASNPLPNPSEEFPIPSEEAAEREWETSEEGEEHAEAQGQDERAMVPSPSPSAQPQTASPILTPTRPLPRGVNAKEEARMAQEAKWLSDLDALETEIAAGGDPELVHRAISAASGTTVGMSDFEFSRPTTAASSRPSTRATSVTGGSAETLNTLDTSAETLASYSTGGTLTTGDIGSFSTSSEWSGTSRGTTMTTDTEYTTDGYTTDHTTDTMAEWSRPSTATTVTTLDSSRLSTPPRRHGRRRREHERHRRREPERHRRREQEHRSRYR